MEQTGLATSSRTRRGLLRLGWGSAAAAIGLGASRLNANPPSGGRILVHLNLFGGNDSHNMLVPLDAAGYRNYEMARGPLAVPQQGLWPLQASSANTPLGIPQALAEVRYLYERKTLAFVANTGYLPVPMTKADVSKRGIPSGAMDHITPLLAYVKDGSALPAWVAPALGLTAHSELVDRTWILDGGIAMISPLIGPGQAFGSNTASNINPPEVVKALAAAPVRNPFPKTALGRGLRKVAQLIHSAPAFGAGTAVILCSAAGFDTHWNQATVQPRLYRELSTALLAFQMALEELGAAQRVTLYTQSEFNRSLVSNSTGGTEHGWGGHEIVMGASVAGGDVYGKYPVIEAGGIDDAAGNGGWIPSTSHMQLGAALAGWVGFNPAQLSQAFPGLQQFDPAPKLFEE